MTRTATIPVPTDVTLARCPDCTTAWIAVDGGWDCEGCWSHLAWADLMLEADEHPVPVDDADTGHTLLGIVKVAETWMEGAAEMIARSDANVGGYVRTDGYDVQQITSVFPDAGLAMAQFAAPSDPGGLVTYVLVIDPA